MITPAGAVASLGNAVQTPRITAPIRDRIEQPRSRVSETGDALIINPACIMPDMRELCRYRKRGAATSPES